MNQIFWLFIIPVVLMPLNLAGLLRAEEVIDLAKGQACVTVEHIELDALGIKGLSEEVYLFNHVLTIVEF